MTLAAGARLGPYEVVSPLGAGGMGEVYRAKDPRLGRDVAVKVLPASFSTDADRLRRFELEARAAGLLNHPNVTAVYDIGSHDGAPYVVSELLEGETLRSRLAAGPLSPRKALDFGIQVARGLAAAHEKGIVHRDLKPENVFVTKDGRVKILDFGLAKLTRPEREGEPPSEAPTQTRATEPGFVMGTVGYMSPEQVRGQPADPRSDIFALGAVLYEMLAGERAFRGDTSVETLSAILKEDPPDLSRSVAGLSPSLDRIVRRCLEKSPEERFQSARDVAFALEEAVASASTPAIVAPVVPSRGRRARWIALGVVVAAVAAVAAVVVVRSLGNRRERPAGPGQSIHSLAVLPLENLSRDPEQEYFADGMTEALISNLARIRALRVISRTSVMRFKGARKPLPEIGRELNVDGIVEGSVLRSGDRVRITAQLVHASSDAHLWAQDYERDARDVLSLQAEVARAIAREIRVAVSPQEQARLGKSRPVDPEAHRLYLLGRYWWNKRNPEGFRKALEYFEQSIAKDPTFAAAHAGLADTYATSGFYSAVRPREAFPKAQAAAERAIELDDTLGEAHASLANVLVNDRKWAAAEPEFRKAIELNPGYAPAHHWYSLLLSALGRLEEADAEMRHAQELDPLSLIVSHNVGLQHYYGRRYDEAIRQYRRTLEMDPGFRVTKVMLMYAYAERGMFREGIAVGEESLRRTPEEPWIKPVLAYVHARAGDRGRALRLLEGLPDLYRQGRVLPDWIAIVYVGLGEKDEAFAWLDKAVEDRTSFAGFLKPSPYYDSLRADPRFAALLRRVGLPP